MLPPPSPETPQSLPPRALPSPPTPGACSNPCYAPGFTGYTTCGDFNQYFNCAQLASYGSENSLPFTSANVAESFAGGEPTIQLAVAAPGVYSLALVAADGTSQGSVRVHRSWTSPRDAAPHRLTDGEPHRVHVATRGWTRLQLSTNAPTMGVEVRAAVLSGQGAMYMCVDGPQVMPDWQYPGEHTATFPYGCDLAPFVTFGANAARGVHPHADIGQLVAATYSSWPSCSGTCRNRRHDSI